MTRISIFTISFPPTRIISCSCNARRSFACMVRGKSSISSKRTVPSFASSKRPILRVFKAPVKAPFSYPNSSDSKRESGIAEQLMRIYGLSRRLLLEKISRATTSLPVPVSPLMRMVASEEAAWLMRYFTRIISGELPIKEEPNCKVFRYSKSCAILPSLLFSIIVSVKSRTMEITKSSAPPSLKMGIQTYKTIFPLLASLLMPVTAVFFSMAYRDSRGASFTLYSSSPFSLRL
ncbi:hypothetical protein SDC9_68761 [bioreactor metagenome]|uniref:Uncharacterized protein n=1 Tax=bioreactor metagenome TaxID=1076179 RepID=A0A644Y1T2_9ZZZZ